MGPWTYYAPLWLGTVLAALLYANTHQQLPPMDNWEHVLVCVLGCPLFGLNCQLVMIGVQGVFAQVLPVPRGRSIRGRAAVVTGGLILASTVLLVVALLLHFEEFTRFALAVLALSLAAALAALVAYVWCWPTAVRDFDARR